MIPIQGPRGSRGRLTGSQGVTGQAYRGVPLGKGVALQGPRGSRVRPIGSRGSGVTSKGYLEVKQATGLSQEVKGGI